MYRKATTASMARRNQATWGVATTIRTPATRPPPIGISQRRRRCMLVIVPPCLGLINSRSRVPDFLDRISQLMASTTLELPLYDRTARKAHQWTMIALVVAGRPGAGHPGGAL